VDAAELELVRAATGQLLGRGSPAGLPAALLESGWVELLSAEPAAAAAILAEEQGRTLSAGPGLELVMLHGAGLAVDATTAVVLPTVGRPTVPPGRRVGGRLVVDGLGLAGHERATTFVVATAEGLFAVPAAALHAVARRGSDPDLGLARLQGDLAGTGAVAVGSADAGASGMNAGRRFLAGELTGLAGRMLDDTVAYVLDRHQFGHPVGSFQAVKHRLADVRVAIAAARAGLASAFDDNTAASATAAKCLAGRAQRLAASHCHQVHGGIAFTVEHGFHRLIRRGQLLDGLLGGTDELTAELGRQLRHAARVPRTPRLREAGSATW